MKRFPLLLFIGVLASCSLWAAEPKEGEVTKLDGKKVFGVIEVTDDYTIRISSDTGLQNIPIAMLSESDFRKFGFAKDRRTDGRFWSERKDALEKTKSSDGDKTANDNKSGGFEIRLAEIAPFQPVIDLYQKSLPDKQPKNDSKEENGKTTSPTADGNSPMGKLFTQPTMGNTPFSGGLAAPVMAPVSAVGSVISIPSGVPAPPTP
jgi:hypothetical protein